MAVTENVVIKMEIFFFYNFSLRMRIYEHNMWQETDQSIPVPVNFYELTLLSPLPSIISHTWSNYVIYNQDK